MKDIEAIAPDIVAREGGFVNDPDDPGGAIKFGVTVGTMKRLGLDLDRDCRVSIRDVQQMDRATAIAIFVQQYFFRSHINILPSALQAGVFDMYVNAGRNAVRILQRLLREMDEPVSVDGIIGPQTAAAARGTHAKAPDHLADACGIARWNHYFALADRRPASRKYACREDDGKVGWITWAEEFISTRFHLSEAEHRGRVAAWV